MQKTSKMQLKIMTILFGIVLTIAMIPCLTANAADMDSYSIRISYYDDDVGPLSNAPFQAYYVGEVKEYGEYELSDEFTLSGVELQSKMSEEDWGIATSILSDWCDSNNIRPTQTGNTDKDGTLILKDLRAGLYVVKGDRVQLYNSFYTPQVFCVMVPDRDDEGMEDENGEAYVEPKFVRDGKPRLPSQTSDPFDYLKWLFVILIAVGIGMVGYILIRKPGKSGEDLDNGSKKR